MSAQLWCSRKNEMLSGVLSTSPKKSGLLFIQMGGKLILLTQKLRLFILKISNSFNLKISVRREYKTRQSYLKNPKCFNSFMEISEAFII